MSPGSSVAVEAVIFDWGGTLTPWRTIVADEEWHSLASVASSERAAEVAQALAVAAGQVWERSRVEHRSATIEEICLLAGVTYDDAALRAYRAYWDPATYTDEDVAPLLGWLRDEGIRVGVLSNTVWPRRWHEEIFERDGIDHLIDGAVYTSEIAWTKPSREAFQAAMEAIGVSEPGSCVFVGGRLFDDIYGARNAGMLAVHLPHSNIPVGQLGHTVGEPHAVIQRLSELPGAIAPWR